MYPIKNPQVDLKLSYKKTIELSLIVSLVLNIGLFRLLPEISSTYEINSAKAIEIHVEDIPPTEQVQNVAPPPARPSVPIPVEGEEIPEDLTIESTDLNLDLSELPPPPRPEEDDIAQQYIFIPYDEPPSPFGGYAAIQKSIKYPEIARKAGMTGIVIIAALIDAQGNPVKTQVLKGTGTNVGFEEAAAAAVKSVKWKPAKQRDRAIKVWISIPIRFKLTDAEKIAS